MKINLHGTYQQQVDFSVTKEELFKKSVENFDKNDVYYLVKNSLFSKMGLKQASYINNGVWYVDKEMYSTHSFDMKIPLRDVTEEDKLILKTLEDLKSIL